MSSPSTTLPHTLLTQEDSDESLAGAGAVQGHRRGNTYINTPKIITYKGQSLFELKRSDADGFLGIDFDVFGRDGKRLATVRNGQFVGDVPDGYALDQTHDQFVVTEMGTARQVCALRLREKAQGDAEIEVSARMYMPDRYLMELTPTGTNLGGIQMSGNTFENCGSAIVIE